MKSCAEYRLDAALPASRSASRIPTGFNHSAQGCEARATLGQRPEMPPTLKGLQRVHPAPHRGCNPAGVERIPPSPAQGSSSIATLGWWTEALQDSQAFIPASRSDAVTVAVGFSPRSPAPASCVAKRRLSGHFPSGSSVAPRRGPSSTTDRGLKPTATFIWSLRDLACPPGL